MSLLVILNLPSNTIEVPTPKGKDLLLVLDKDEALALNDYFLKRAGYVSHEFDQKVIDFNKRLDNYVEKIRFEDVVKEKDKESSKE